MNNNNAPVAAIKILADHIYNHGLHSGDIEETAPLAAALKCVDEWLRLHQETAE